MTYAIEYTLPPAIEKQVNVPLEGVRSLVDSILENGGRVIQIIAERVEK